LIFDFTPLLWAGAGVLLFSALFWLPLIRGITRSISRIQDATARIAEGQFDVQVSERRRDELGSLSGAINRMSERLAGLLSGQRRFLSDVAHELCAPLSRLQMALGILEETATPAENERLRDLREEVDQIAELVNQLLSFSRAAIGSTQVELRDVPVRHALEKAAHREIGEAARVEIECDPGLAVKADPDFLQRALGNLFRNALHHGASTGLIAATAQAEADEVLITIEDEGPGVPEETLPRLFDPFFRVDSARARETGGVGLGLTIARTCLDACGGQISARNRPSGGLELRIRLPIARPSREATAQKSYRALPLASRQ
jgi:two-component system sensor histidine kinase CpxA